MIAQGQKTMIESYHEKFAKRFFFGRASFVLESPYEDHKM
jgi:hypothetical protein